MAVQTSISTATCQACGSARTRTHAPSRTSGNCVVRCRDCGYSTLLNPPEDDSIVAQYDLDESDYNAFIAGKRQVMLDVVYVETLNRVRQLQESTGADLFDVGAGGGEFLDIARAEGFKPYGNELSAGAVQIAQERHGIRLEHADLSGIEGENRYDAMTMWCVLAHVPNPRRLLADAYRLLAPGGVLFLQTPRWSAMDTAALTASRISRGRYARVLDRRIHSAHLRLHSVSSIREDVAHGGFDVVEVRPRARYTLQTKHYLVSLGLPESASARLARLIDQAVDRDLFFRNILDVFARKPL